MDDTTVAYLKRIAEALEHLVSLVKEGELEIRNPKDNGKKRKGQNAEGTKEKKQKVEANEEEKMLKLLKKYNGCGTLIMQKSGKKAMLPQANDFWVAKKLDGQCPDKVVDAYFAIAEQLSRRGEFEFQVASVTDYIVRKQALRVKLVGWPQSENEDKEDSEDYDMEIDVKLIADQPVVQNWLEENNITVN